MIIDVSLIQEMTELGDWYLQTLNNNLFNKLLL
jgi:hypothetical protein